MTDSAPLNPQGTICHVYFSVPNLDKAKAFYGELFGWEFHPFGEGRLFFDAPEPGPSGSIGLGIADQNPRTVFFVNVDDIAKTVEKAESLGGKLVGRKREIPDGIGYYALLRAPEGNMIGLYSPA